MLLVLLLAYGLHNGLAWVRTQQRALQSIAEAESRRISEIEQLLGRLESGHEGQPPAFLDARLPATMGDAEGGAVRHAVLRPAPLAALAVGLSDLLPYYLQVTIRSSGQLFLENGELDNPHHLLAGRFDVAFVIVGLLPLLVLSLCYDVLSGEKEQGTLALVLAQPVRLRTWLASRLAVRAISMLTLTVACLVVALLIAGVDLRVWDVLGRVVGWCAVVVVYTSFWLALAIWVNALGRSSAANATILAAAWLAFVVVVPALGSIAASGLHPAPSRVGLVGATRQAQAEAAARGARVLADYSDGDGHVARDGLVIDPANIAAVTYLAHEHVDRQLQPLLSDFNARVAAQQGLVMRYRFLSPAMLAQDALIELAGAGPGRHQHFRKTVEVFIRDWKEYFAPRIFRQERLGPGATTALPTYAYAEEPLSAVLRRTAPAFIGLVLLTLVTLAIALRRLHRYSVAG